MSRRVDHSTLPCTRCGGPRDRQNSRCRACATAIRTALKHANPEKHRAYQREYYWRNPEHHRAVARHHYDRHREQRIAKAMEWIYNNPERRRAIMQRRWQREEENGGRGYDEGHWLALVERTDGRCAYCRVEDAEYADHYMPISRGGQDDYANIVPSCCRCNQRKGSVDPVEWITRTFGAEHIAYVRSIMLE